MSEDVHKGQTEEWPELAEFKQRFRTFVAERDWEQFHSPKPAIAPVFRSEGPETPPWCRARTGRWRRRSKSYGEPTGGSTRHHGGWIGGRSRKSGAIAGSNLAIPLAGEAGELLELFQWLSENESRNLPDEAKQAVAFEIADIQIYLATLSDRLGIDIGPAVAKKMKLNAEKYPPDLARGTALKYSKLQDR